jgi:antitoxin VapB
MITANLITEGAYQIVRLPKEFEFTGINQVEIRKKGNSIIMTPCAKAGKALPTLPKPIVIH